MQLLSQNMHKANSVCIKALNAFCYIEKSKKRHRTIIFMLVKEKEFQPANLFSFCKSECFSPFSCSR